MRTYTHATVRRSMPVCVCTKVRAFGRWNVPDEDRHDQCPGQRDGAGLQRLDALDVRYFCVDLFFVEK